MDNVAYAMWKQLPGTSFEDAVSRVREALRAEGFGVLTSIDVRATLKEKIGEEFRPYVILGACNPSLAHRALTADDNLGLLLPCNVVVAETEAGSEISVARPSAMLAVAGSEGLEEVAREAETRLWRALVAV